jgi:hypothetical protein
MRLLNARTLKFEEFFDNAIPEFALLSHTWGAEEVSFQDALRLTSATGSPVPNDLACKAGWDKIKRTCGLALRDNLEYAWIDTCCIDKTSSAELSEAINSMFHWYERSKVCYAYLADVPATGTLDLSNPGDQFKASRWLTRGWTLQELLAPSNVVFFASDWTYIATRHELAAAISSITGIHRSLLQLQDVSSLSCVSQPAEPASKRLWDVINVAGASPSHVKRSHILDKLRGSSIAERMSWAAKRQTTRVEDTAYCLLGIFEIHMPLIYGEGPRAFIRLQEEIMRKSDDMTILAWHFRLNNQPLKPILPKESPWAHPWKVFHYAPRYGSDCRSVGLLAESPAAFLGCEDIVPSEASGSAGTAPSTLSSKGLSTRLPLSDDKHPHIVLPCRLKDDPWHLIALPLVCRDANSYARAHMPSRLVDHNVWHRWRSTSVNLLTSVDEYDSRPQIPEDSFWVRELPDGYEIADVHPRATYALSERIIVPHGAPFGEQPIGGRVTAGISLRNQNSREGQDFLVILHATKLYTKGIGWIRPVRTTYMIVPSHEGRRPLQVLAVLATDGLPCESLQYGVVDLANPGFLYVTMQRQICFGKPLFVLDVKHERRSLQGWFLRLWFDLVAIVVGWLRDCVESRRVFQSLVALGRPVLLCWEDFVRGSAAVVVVSIGFYMVWMFYSNYDAPPQIRSWIGWGGFAGVSLVLSLLIYELVPFLSVSFPRFSPVIRRFRFLLALIIIALGFDVPLTLALYAEDGPVVYYLIPMIFPSLILWHFGRQITKDFF